jgi:competence protein ComGF
VAEYENFMKKRRAYNNNNDRGKEIIVNDITASGALADDSFSMVIFSYSFSNNEITKNKTAPF